MLCFAVKYIFTTAFTGDVADVKSPTSSQKIRLYRHKAQQVRIDEMDDPTKMVFKIRNMVIFVTVGINTVSKQKAPYVFENATFRQPEVQDPRPARR